MLKLEVTGVGAVAQRIRDLPRQMRFAAAQAVNETAFVARGDLQTEMASVFDRPTPWIQKSIYVQPATTSSPQAVIYPRRPGANSIDPANVLLAEVFGGARKVKRFEIALQRIGVLPQGMVTVPGKAAPLDGFGNVSSGLLVRLLAYFEAFGAESYRSNSSASTRARLGKVKRVNGYLKITGVQYFVSQGKGSRATRAVNAQGQLSRGEGQLQHLPAGIWSRTGTHGVDIKPILMFVRAPRYTERFNVLATVQQTVQRELPSRYARWVGVAISTAK